MKYYSFLICNDRYCNLGEFVYGQPHTDVRLAKDEIVKMLSKDGLKMAKRIEKLTESDFADGLTICFGRNKYITLTTEN